MRIQNASDVIYQTLQSVVGCELVVVLRQESPVTVTGGLRSRSLIDVGTVATLFGGGGHVRAAGFSCPGTVAEVRKRLLAAVGPLFS